MNIGLRGNFFDLNWHTYVEIFNMFHYLTIFIFRMSLNDVFSSLESSKNQVVREESRRPDHVIQKYIILDEIPALMLKIGEWIEDENLPTPFLRFLAHLVLFFDQIDQQHNKEVSENVLQL